MCLGRGLSYIESLPSAPQEKEEDSAMGIPWQSLLFSYIRMCLHGVSKE